MRLVAGTTIIARGLTTLRSGPATDAIALSVLGIAAGALLIVGLWTPIAGSLVAILEVWSAISQSGDPWTSILLATMGAVLALVGPGAWSIDARLFGWKRIDVRNRKS